MKVILVTNIPTPYRLPLFNNIASQCREKDILFKVIFGAKSYKRRQWIVRSDELKFDHTFLNSTKLKVGNIEKVLFFYNGVIKEIKKYNPDVIIVSGFSLVLVKLLITGLGKGRKIIIWSGSIINKNKPVSLLRETYRKWVVRKVDGGIVYGNKAKEYFISLGMPEEKINIAFNSVDVDFFVREADKSRLVLPEADKSHLLYVGYLSKRKNVMELLHVVNFLSKKRCDFVLDVVGDGDDRTNLELFTKKNQLEKYVVFHGYKQKEDIPFYLAQATCFLFQTSFDIWGLVLVEAMAAGLPCIASINAGASFDLIEDGKTGFVVDFKNHLVVLEKIEMLLDKKDICSLIGRNASKKINENFTLIKSASKFIEAVETV